MIRYWSDVQHGDLITNNNTHETWFVLNKVPYVTSSVIGLDGYGIRFTAWSDGKLRTLSLPNKEIFLADWSINVTG